MCLTDFDLEESCCVFKLIRYICSGNSSASRLLPSSVQKSSLNELFGQGNKSILDLPGYTARRNNISENSAVISKGVHGKEGFVVGERKLLAENATWDSIKDQVFYSLWLFMYS